MTYSPQMVRLVVGECKAGTAMPDGLTHTSAGESSMEWTWSDFALKYPSLAEKTTHVAAGSPHRKMRFQDKNETTAFLRPITCNAADGHTPATSAFRRHSYGVKQNRFGPHRACSRETQVCSEDGHPQAEVHQSASFMVPW